MDKEWNQTKKNERTHNEKTKKEGTYRNKEKKKQTETMKERERVRITSWIKKQAQKEAERRKEDEE